MNNNLLINRNFALLWVGKIISQIGDKFYAIALAWWILQKTNSPGTMGFFLFVSVLPGLVLGFYAGAIADRLNRRNVLVITDILRGSLILLVVLLSFLQILMVSHVFVIGAALSLVTAFFDPAAGAIIPQLVDREVLGKANSMNQMVNGLCTILGPVLGAIAITFFGMTAVFLFNGISYFISAVFSSMVSLSRKKEQYHKSNTIFQDMKEGIIFLKANRALLRIISIIAVVHFFMGCLMVLMPFLSKCLKGKGIQNLGYLETFLGIGLFIGALYITRKKKTIMREVTLLIIILAIGSCFLAISGLLFITIQGVLPYFILFLLIGCGISGASVFWQSMIQLQTPGAMTGRVFSVSSLAGNVSLPIAYGTFGILLTFLPIKIIMLFCGSALISLSCILLLTKSPGKYDSGYNAAASDLNKTKS